MNLYYCLFNYNGRNHAKIVREETDEKARKFYCDWFRGQGMSLLSDSSVSVFELEASGPPGFVRRWESEKSKDMFAEHIESLTAKKT